MSLILTRIEAKLILYLRALVPIFIVLNRMAGMAGTKRATGEVTDTNVETVTTFIMRESKDRELAVFMNAMTVRLTLSMNATAVRMVDFMKEMAVRMSIFHECEGG